MLDPNQTSLYTPTTKDTHSTITITPSLAIGACSVAGSIVQNVWDHHKSIVDTDTAPSELTENDGGEVRMHRLDICDEQPIPSEAAGQTPALDPSPLSAAAPVILAPSADATPADEPEDHNISTSTSIGIEVHTTECSSVPGVTASTSEPGGITAPSSGEEQTKPLRQGYDVTTGTFYYFHEATPPPKPKQVEPENTDGENGQGDTTMNEEAEDGEEEKSGESTGEPERSPSPRSSALSGLMRTRRRPRVSYTEPYSMRDSESRSPSPAAPARPKRFYGKRGSRQRSGSDGCPPPPTLRGGKTSTDFYIPPLPTNIEPVESIKQMTMEQKTKLAMELGGRPLRKKELVYILERMDPDLKNNTDRGWVNTLSQGNSVRKSTKSAKGKIEIKTQVVSLESDYVTGYFWWLPDTPHQCKPDDLFRERLGNNRRMDIRTSFTPTPMEGVVQPEPGERSYRSVVPLLEEEDE